MSEYPRGAEIPDPTDSPIEAGEYDLEKDIAEIYVRLEAIVPGIKEKLSSMSVEEREKFAADLDSVVTLDETLPE